MYRIITDVVKRQLQLYRSLCDARWHDILYAIIWEINDWKTTAIDKIGR